MLTPDDQRALDRVRKLFALATSPNVHEAASAAAQAQTLIDRHRLQAILDAERAANDPDDDPITDARDQPLESARKIRPWKALLALTLAEHNGCVAYTLELDRSQSLVLVGRACDRAAVETLWSWLVRRIEWLSATHGAGRSRRWHDDFRAGAVDAIAQQLRTCSASADLSTTALARVDAALEARDAALKSFIERHMRLGDSRAIRVDPRAWTQGKRLAEAQTWLPRLGEPMPE